MVEEQDSEVWQSHQIKSKQGNGVQHWEQQGSLGDEWRHYIKQGQQGIATAP